MKPQPFVDNLGVTRHLTTILPDARDALSPYYAAGDPDIPRSQWEEVDHSEWCPPIMNQGSTPQCGGFSTAAAHTAACNMSGRTLGAVLSPGWVYGYCKRPGGGIIVRDALTCLRDRGCPYVTTVGPFDINPNGYSQKAKKQAGEYKLVRANQVLSFDQGSSALLRGYVVEFGCLIGENFHPDPQTGIVPDQAGTSGGHAMYAVGLKNVNGQWYWIVRNSWGEDWGLGGTCLMPESYFWLRRPGYPYINLDAFTIEAARQDAADSEDLPDVG